MSTPAVRWIPPGRPVSERLLVGSLYLTTAGIFLLLQISVLLLFLLYPDFRSHRCYRIMIAISAVDSVQLIALAYSGLITLFNDSFNPWLEKALGGLANTINCCEWALGLVLALNRLLVFMPHKIGAIVEKRIFNCLLALSLIWGLIPYPVYLTPSFGMAFRNYTWDYVTIAPDWKWLKQFTEIQAFIFLGLTLLTYSAILCVMISLRGKISSASSTASRGATTTTRGGGGLAPHELRLLLQAVVQFLVEFSLCVLWAWPFLGGILGKAYVIFINWYWMFMCGFKPILYLAMNRTIRARILLLWRFKLERNCSSFSFRTKQGRNNNGQLQQQEQMTKNIRTINISVNHGRC